MLVGECRQQRQGRAKLGGSDQGGKRKMSVGDYGQQRQGRAKLGGSV